MHDVFTDLRHFNDAFTFLHSGNRNNALTNLDSRDFTDNFSDLWDVVVDNPLLYLWNLDDSLPDVRHRDLHDFVPNLHCRNFNDPLLNLRNVSHNLALFHLLNFHNLVDVLHLRNLHNSFPGLDARDLDNALDNTLLRHIPHIFLPDGNIFVDDFLLDLRNLHNFFNNLRHGHLTDNLMIRRVLGYGDFDYTLDRYCLLDFHNSLLNTRHALLDYLLHNLRNLDNSLPFFDLRDLPNHFNWAYDWHLSHNLLHFRDVDQLLNLLNLRDMNTLLHFTNSRDLHNLLNLMNLRNIDLALNLHNFKWFVVTVILSSNQDTILRLLPIVAPDAA
mmetsp:Transcript_30951/g.74160  ORF Transcript_30951/g.74160 Transcript_30951/m.74160 type:complete len:330 (+) Transcript_30951:445-1434(+)